MHAEQSCWAAGTVIYQTCANVLHAELLSIGQQPKPWGTNGALGFALLERRLFLFLDMAAWHKNVAERASLGGELLHAMVTKYQQGFYSGGF